ncbi:ATP-dependent nuclease [Commensalibacter oyaizuii]|uniref:AAA family ATPase n=1 Tax=Commensalibacter oyaizuii TaxID=3043873 RepID=A0ABT6Q3V6_9PROT|nr:AAA family ATPase [Commensalibacter sp. TBRC 16381]MDI2091256.1 AAA family ATPase [Commensalibacter sp. TBRC 16381]
MSEEVARPSVFIQKIKFLNGKEIAFEKSDKIIIAGPNNSGKSQLLKEIYAACNEKDKFSFKVIGDIELCKQGTQQDLTDFLNRNAIMNMQYDRYEYKMYHIYASYIPNWDKQYLMGIADIFIQKIFTKGRLDICDQKKTVAPSEQKLYSQHILYDNDQLMCRISTLFKQAFGKDLMIDFRGGSVIPFHVGDVPSIPDRVSDEYIDLVRKNPLLDQQGDGMRSYAGILFEAITAETDITLIDEPEAFLHPPQMRRLGETLAAEVQQQLVVATHSSDIMRGFLQETSGKLRILRIQRNNNTILIHDVSPDIVRELWQKPELRYSNALDSIFHEQTIICEDDSDCRLINAVADFLAKGSEERYEDTFYVPTGGKHAIPKIAGVLRQIGVPIKAVFDLDFLNDEGLLKKTIQAFGGDWDDFKDLWIRLDKAIKNENKNKDNNVILKEIISLCQTACSAQSPEIPVSEIKKAMKIDNPWHEIKKHGSTGISKGQSWKDYEALNNKLEQIGIYLIPVGEIENFCRGIGGHGPKYVTKLLEEVSLGDDRLMGLRSFVETVYGGSCAPFK